MNYAFEAMAFARAAHHGQVRKYVGNPYIDHCIEVAGLVATLAHEVAMADGLSPREMIAVALLHDVREDCGVTDLQLSRTFGCMIAHGVELLSDLETEGNRAERKAASRVRLAAAPGWVQTIKCADLISNTQSIVRHDPKFAVTYLEEKRLLLDVMTQADRRLWTMARDIAESA